MRKILFTILLFSICLTLNASGKMDGRIKSFDVTANGEVIARVESGNLTVDTWEINKVEIKVKGIKESDLENYSVKQIGSEITLRYEGGSSWDDKAQFFITVPNQFNLDLKTLGGNISLRKTLQGNIKFNSMGGNLSVENVKGDIDLYTAGGNINTGDLIGYIEISTMGGNITSGSFDGEKAEISTMGGDIKVHNVINKLTAVTYGGDIKIQDIGGNAELKTFGGDVKIQNSTGDIIMGTFGGDLKLKSSSGKVVAETSGGDIKLFKLTGYVNAHTLGGDIVIELNPEPNSESFIESSGGDVTLIIPETANAFIQAVIEVRGHWKSNKDDYEIRSDYSSSSYEFNESSKEIIGEYIINNESSLINLKTINGDIKIRSSN